MTEPVRLAKRLAEMLACSRREAEQYIAGSQYVVFDSLGHVPQEEDPQRSVAEVLKFLASKR